MLFEAVPPEAVPLLPALFLSFGILAGAAVCWGLAKIVDGFVRALFGTVSGAVGWIPWLGKVITRPIHEIEQKLVSLLGTVEQGFAKAVGAAWHDLARVFVQLGNAIVDTAAIVFGLAALVAQLAVQLAAEKLFARHSVAQTQAQASTQAHVARDARARARAAERDATAIAHTTTAITRDEANWRGWTRSQLRWLRAHLARLGVSVGAAATTAVDVLPGTIRRGIPAIWPRIKALERRIGVAGLTGVVAYALGRMGATWIRCGNWRSIGRAGCNLPRDLIEALLAGSLEALAVADLCELVTLINQAALEFEPVLLAFTRAELALIGCRGMTVPPAIPLAGLTFTPVVDPIAA